MLAIVLCIHVSMHQFILFSFDYLSCTIYIYHEHCIMIFMHYRLVFEKEIFFRNRYMYI